MSMMGDVWLKLLGIGISAISIFWANGTLAQSKIIPDNTLGAEKSNVVSSFNGLPIEVINNGAIRGQNLFHSFLEFNVSAGRGAYFLSPSAAIKNIVTRVTGNNRSEILGVLGTFGNSNPNLFLINPNGIIFGPNASLYVGGSFVATTANAIQFGSQGFFSASEPNNPALLTVNPSALFYNQIAAGASIQNSSQASVNGFVTGLQVPDGKSLLLVGGDINIDGGGLTANGGRVELASLAAPGNIGLNVAGDTLSLSVPSNVQRGNISLKNQAFVDVTGLGQGDIAVNANNLDITGGSQLSAGIEQGLGTVGAQAGDITLNATGEIKVVGSSVFNDVGNNVGLFAVDNGGNLVVSVAHGNGGNIKISSSSFSLTNGAYLSASTYGQGNGGSVKIDASRSVSIDNSSIRSNVGDSEFTYQGVRYYTLGMGNSGGISINTGSLTVANSAELNTSTTFGGTGRAGDITIKARDLVLFDGGFARSRLELGGKGRGGDIRITTDGSVKVTGIPTDYAINANTGQLVTATFGEGDAGNVMIIALKDVSFDGRGSDIFSLVAGNKGMGNAGDIIIDSRSLSVSNGARLVARTEGQGNAGNINITAHDTLKVDGNGSDIDSFVAGGTGRGGTITLKTGALSLTNGAFVTAGTSGIGAAGNVIIDATNNVSVDHKSTISSSSSDDFNGGDIQIKSSELSLTNGASLQASASGKGNAGDIMLQTGNLILDNGAFISAQTASSDGGNIVLKLSDYLLLRNNSLISATAGTNQAGGNSGNITINTPFVIAFPQQNSDITANAFSGSGGRVAISATDYFNIAPLSRQDLERLRPNDLDPRQLPTNDITAVSQQNPNLNGTVQINTPDIDPSRGLVILPTVTENAPKLVSSSCAAFNETADGSNFTVTGRGGLPSSPDEPLTSDVVWTDTRLPTTTRQHKHKTHASFPNPQPIAIVPATGWVFNGKGEVTLISRAPNATTVNTPTSCPAR